MVLTNFECWAHGGSDNLSADPMVERHGNSMDLFNPAALQQTTCGVVDNQNGIGVNCGAETHARNVSHFSSNGYYGFVACSALNSGASTVDDANRTTGENYADKQPVREAAHNAISLTDDTMMEIQQEHMVLPQWFAATSGGGGVVNSMFLGHEPASVKFRENNGFGVDRRKRGFAIMDGSRDITKRFRKGDEDGWPLESDHHLSIFSKERNQHLAMDQDGIPSEDFTLTQTMLNPTHSQHTDNEHQSAPSISDHHATNQLRSLNKSIQCKKNKLETNPLKSHLSLEVNLNVENINKSIQSFTYSLKFCDAIDRNVKSRIDSGINTNLELSNDHNKANANNAIQYNNDEDVDLLENLFLSLHGGTNMHMWRHLSKYRISADEI